MTASASSFLTPWSNFFVMTATSAAALTGLMFIVITLVTGAERSRKTPDGISTFSTPTVVHFCLALLVSALLVAPWPSLAYPALLLGLAGVFGVLYVVRVMRLTRRLSAYTPDKEDWAWYGVMPLVADGAIFAGAVMLDRAPGGALFALAGGVMLLVFVGIRNAWDVVTYLAIRGAEEPPDMPSAQA